ncbi:hypothetical protein GWI33_021799 [Rhynchophorus ferrugineus]|uniref:Ionotropic receptor n=1 Tax=Rhynchophorus ferrugineus TaxID=354439 RepID=A0A834J0V7_RHYFE|nr:hypothetical protein GWI33_021799 [Rhynchophorus ferrugineus]
MENANFNLQDTKTSLTVLLIEDITKFEEELTRLLVSEYYTNQGNYQFIFCTSINKTGDISKFKSKIVKITYDPFLDSVKFADPSGYYSLTNRQPSYINMQGSALPLLQMERISENKLPRTYNYDENVSNALKKALNATMRLQILAANELRFDYIVSSVSKSDAQCCLKTQSISYQRIAQEYVNNVTYSYPHMMNHIVALVPKPKQTSHWKLIFGILKIKYAIFIVLSSAVFSFLEKVLYRSDNNSFLMYILVSFKIPVSKFTVRKSTLKATWIIATFFLSIFFDNEVLHAILNREFETRIKTLKELQQTNLPIYYFENVSLNIRYQQIPRLKWRYLLFDNKVEAVFLSPYLSADMYIKYFANIKQNFHYEIMEEVVMPAFGAYICKKRSPFLTVFDRVSLKVREFGINDRVPYKYRKIDIKENTLKFDDFKGTFLILIVGNIMGLVVFLWEIGIRNKIQNILSGLSTYIKK